MFFLVLIAFLLLVNVKNAVLEYIEKHTVYEMSWQQCPICEGTGHPTQGNKIFLCDGCSGKGGWVNRTRKRVYRS